MRKLFSAPLVAMVLGCGLLAAAPVALANDPLKELVDLAKTAELSADAELPDLLGAIRR